MFFDTDRCLQCGTYDRPTKLNTEYASHIKPDGSLWYTGYWVCSDECFNDAIFSMMPKEYWPAHYHTIDEHPKIKALRRDLEEKYEEDAGYHQAEYDIEAKRIWQEFTKERAEVHRATSRKFINHVTAKWNLEQKKRAEQERVEAQKEADRQQREQDRVEERNRRELEQQMRERKKIEEEHHRREAYEKMIATKPIPEARRFEHTHILGPSGSGKTTLIQQIILDDLAKPDPPAYIVIDPKGELVWRLSHLNVFSLHHVGKSPPGRLAERLVIIDPELRPALNVFQETEGKPAQIVSTFSYVFSTTRQSLTGKQATCFSFCVRLLFTIPGSNLFTFLDLLEDEQADPRFKNAISNLTKPSEAAARRFFQYDFYSKNYSATRQEIRTRIWEVLQDEYLFTMLNADERTIDIAQCIREHKIVLVNTRMAELKLAHQTLGRYILALAVNALQARAGTPKSTWHPTFIVIDEFQEFADEHKTPEMLRLIREYNGGVILAHHNMSQRNSMMAFAARFQPIRLSRTLPTRQVWTSDIWPATCTASRNFSRGHA
jgi:ABC-type lipoprotein export system ATPase subunit